MKVLTVTTSYPRSAGDMAGRFVARGCAALVARGHSVRVLCPHASGIDARESVDGVEVERVRYGLGERSECVAYGDGIPDNLARSWASRLWLPFFVLAMRRAVKGAAGEADVVHAHWTASGWMAAGACRQRRRPLVLTLRGSDVAARGWGLRWVARQALAAASHVFCVSADMQEAALGLGARPETLEVLPNGLDLERFLKTPDGASSRQALGLDPEGIYLISVGRLAAVKDVPFLLQCFARLTRETHGDLEWMAGANARYPALAGLQHELVEDMTTRGFVGRLGERIARTRLLLVGDGEERQALMAQADSLGIADRVRFVGQVPDREVPGWLAASDIFVLTSRREGRSNALVEAMAAGLPCVAGAVAGVRGLIEHAATGLLYEPQDATGLMGSLCYLLFNDGQRQAMGALGRRQVQARALSWNDHAERLERVYQGLVGSQA